jgi:predicted DNA-binding transcriptional regulator YafY
MPTPATRVLAVLELLQARGTVGGAELAERLQVDRRTVRRYVAMLEELGIPIAAERGRDGGYRLVAGFKLPPLMFTNHEAVALTVGLRAARHLGLAEAAPATASALAKLERVTPPSLKRLLRGVSETIALDIAPGASGSNDALVTLGSAALNQQRVRLEYVTPAGQRTVRRFDPYGLGFRGGQWYAVGHCHLRRDLRSFRLDRIAAVEPLPANFRRPERFDVLDYLARSIATLPRLHSAEVLLDTDMATARRNVFSGFGVLKEDRRGVRLRIEAESLDWVARELARLPFAFTVVRPAALDEEVRALAARLLNARRKTRRGSRTGT